MTEQPDVQFAKITITCCRTCYRGRLAGTLLISGTSRSRRRRAEPRWVGQVAQRRPDVVRGTQARGGVSNGSRDGDYSSRSVKRKGPPSKPLPSSPFSLLQSPSCIGCSFVSATAREQPYQRRETTTRIRKRAGARSRASACIRRTGACMPQSTGAPARGFGKLVGERRTDDRRGPRSAATACVANGCQRDYIFDNTDETRHQCAMGRTLGQHRVRNPSEPWHQRTCSTRARERVEIMPSFPLPYVREKV